MYLVEMNYPSGKVELLDISFEKIEDADKYGHNMLIQIENTERFHKYEDDGIGQAKKQKPYYLVLEVNGRNKEVVLDSRK